jgi:hypothetical protein
MDVDKCEASLFRGSERAFTQNHMVLSFSFLIGDTIVIQKTPGCPENRQKSIPTC